MSPIAKYRLIGFAAAIVLFLVDQAMKGYVTETLALQRGDVVELLPFFDLRLTYNYGVSLGMFQADSMEMRWILVGVTGLIALVVAVWMLREKMLGEIVGLSLILGGALGNLVDRVPDGAVTDFIDLHTGGWHFPTFNLADVGITAGVMMLLCSSLFRINNHTVPASRD